MIKQKILFGLFILSLCWAPLSTKAQAQPAGRNTYAIVIGISGYQDPAVPRLTYADRDAGLFADWLKNNKTNPIKENNLKLFLNENATIANIYSGFDWLKNEVSAEDYVYLYFSGHGDIETDQKTSKGYLLAWNSPPNNYANNAVSVNDLNELANSLTTLNKANVILITDACHSGKMAGDFYKGRELTANNLRLVLNNQVRLAACQANELAAEGPGWGGGRGIFSYYLLKGLEGFAKTDSLNQIRVEDLAHYLDSSFKRDEGLKIEKHIQNPVVDGNPVFPLAMLDSSVDRLAQNTPTHQQQPDKAENNGLQSLKSLGEQPIDYFFSIVNKGDLDSMLDYKKYINLAPQEIPLNLVSDYLENLKHLKKKLLEATLDDSDPIFEQIITQLNDRDEIKIQTLQEQLKNNKYLVSRFNENLVQSVHKKCQVLINAYLAGDLAELEKRQYYNTGKKPYHNFISLLQLAIHITPKSHYLYNILTLNKHYLAGLELRTQMALSKTGSDSLLQKAFMEQRQALELEPYAAYIQNELGNLYMHKENFDSAMYYYTNASASAPTWAIPWSNKIRVYFALKKPKEAYEAAQIADSLQPNLSFVNVNTGLVMEKDSNWLAAESYYLNAIAQNNMHYLPFERLGFVYLHTGEYAESEKYFEESAWRKKLYAVNDKVFRFGTEAGGIGGEGQTTFREICYSLEEQKIIGWSDLNKLITFLAAIDTTNNINSEATLGLETLFKKSPQLPFAAHYLGKQYVKADSLSQAEKAFKQALRDQSLHQDLYSNLALQLKNGLPENYTPHEKDSLVDNSCVFRNLQQFSYDPLEDYYLLGKVLERQKKLPEAVQVYKSSSEIENRRLLDQANLKDIETAFDHSEIISRYEIPIRMSGSIKMAQLYEQLKEYDSAEFVLLDQVKKNQRAGFARWAKKTSENQENFYWLRANEDLEAATYNFYSRMLAQFPRETNWYKNAGLFLYRRLALSYNQVPLQEQEYFYEYSLKWPYPFRDQEEGEIETPDLQKQRLTVHNEFALPGTNEKMSIEMQIYDPLARAAYFLEQAIKYSGEKEPESSLLLNLAKLNSWRGNKEAAINYFENYLSQKPQDDSARNQFINYLHSIHQFVQEANQLSLLNNHKGLDNEQVIRLARYQILSKQAGKAKILLANVIPQNAEDKNAYLNCRVKLFIRNGNYIKAISLLKDSLTFKDSKMAQDTMDYEEILKEDEKKYNSIYARARLHTLLKENKTVFLLIKQILNSDLRYYEVLKNDPVLKNIRMEKEWKNLWAKHPFSVGDLPVKIPLHRLSANYRVPNKE